MSYTRLQLANRALVKLGVVGTGQSPEAEDTDAVSDIFPSFSAYLTQAGIYSIADEDDIDDAAFEWLADYLAYFAASDFGLPIDETKRQRAEYMLRKITTSGPSYQVQKALYY